jgi:uncharacterized protein YkwD
VNQAHLPEAALTRTRHTGRTVFAAVALSALALSAGFAADRVLLAEPTSDFTTGAGPRVAPHPSGSPITPRTERTDDIAESAAPLKPVRRETTPPPRRIIRTTSPPAAAPSRRPAATTLVAEAEEAVIRLTNEARARAGCPAVRFDARLRTAARRHSMDMGLHDYFGHDSRDGDTFADRITDAGYPRPGAENIARGYRTAAAVMDGWMDSAGHRANILNCGLRTIGVGMYDGPGGPWWTQDFGWP